MILMKNHFFVKSIHNFCAAEDTSLHSLYGSIPRIIYFNKMTKIAFKFYIRLYYVINYIIKSSIKESESRKPYCTS